MNAIVTPEVARAITDRAERLAGDIRQNIDNCMRNLKAYQEQLAAVEAKATAYVAMAQRLTAAGLKFRTSSYDEYLTVQCEQKDLPAVHKVVGRLREWNKEVENPRRKLVRVTLQAVHHDNLVFVEYVKKLPKGAKCRIEARRSKPSTYHSLVCEI